MKKNIYTLLIVLLTGSCLTAATGAAAVAGVDIHGFISQGYMLSTDDTNFMVPETDDGIFEFNEMGINFSARPSDFSSAFSEDLALGVQLLAFDFGDVGNHEVTIDWAYGDYAFRDYLGLRAGIMKMPHGLYNETRKIDMLRPSIFLPSSVYPEWFREVMTRIEGAGVYGTLFNVLSYQALYGNISMDSDGGLAGAINALLDDTGMIVTDANLDDSFSVALQWDTPLENLRFGASYMSIDMNSVNMAGTTSESVPLPTSTGIRLEPITLNGVLDWEPLDIWVVSGEYQRDRLTVAIEYVEYTLDFILTTGTSANQAWFPALVPELNDLLTNPIRTDLTPTGGYIQVAYRLLDNLEMGVYYSEYYMDKNENDSEDWRDWHKDACLSVRYDINENWCAKVEAHNIDGSFLVMNNTDARHWQLYSAKLSYLF